MNVFYNTDTRGLKALPSEFIDEMETADCSPVTCYFTNSAVFTICSEGALYVSPRYKDGSFDSGDWVEVDFMEVMAGEGQVYFDLVTAIQDCLVVELCMTLRQVITSLLAVWLSPDHVSQIESMCPVCYNLFGTHRFFYYAFQ